MQIELQKCIQQTLFIYFYPTPANLVVHTPNTHFLVALNGVCTKRNMAWFELLLFENKINNNSQTWPLIHLTSLTTFYSKILLLKWSWVIAVKEYYKCEMNMKWIWIHMNKMANFSFGWNTHTASLLLDTFQETYNQVILSWKILFKVAFRCMFY